MTEYGLTGRHELLRAAAVEVLKAAPREEGQRGSPLAVALERLRDVLRGDPSTGSSAGDGGPTLDPFKNYLTELHYADGEPPAW
jgi:hypothetical protein